MSDEPQVERRDGRLWLGWQGDMVPLQYIGAALGEMVLQREAEIERLTQLVEIATEMAGHITRPIALGMQFDPHVLRHWAEVFHEAKRVAKAAGGDDVS